MQFRVQAKKLQFIRSIYNKETKRCDQKLVGSMSAYSDKMPSAEQIEMLTDSEREELSVYLKNKADKNLSDDRAHVVASIGYFLNRTSDAILAGEKIADQQAIQIWEGLAKVSKAMKKAGHPKPVKSVDPIHPTNPGTSQGDLLTGV